jgi:hypothetical protein
MGQKRVSSINIIAPNFVSCTLSSPIAFCYYWQYNDCILLLLTVQWLHSVTTDSTVIAFCYSWQYNDCILLLLTIQWLHYVTTDSTMIAFCYYWQYNDCFLLLLTVQWLLSVTVFSCAVKYMLFRVTLEEGEYCKCKTFPRFSNINPGISLQVLQEPTLGTKFAG